jgi:hypothetical protein
MKAGRVLIRGTISGVLATALMSTVFSAADHSGLFGRKPPRIIIDHFLPFLQDKTADRVALLSHLGYGVAGGVVYAALPLPAGMSWAVRAGRGLVFGLCVWAASYEGWLPIAGVLPPAHRDKPGRAFSIIAAHIVYGITLGLLGQKTGSRADGLKTPNETGWQAKAATG